MCYNKAMKNKLFYKNSLPGFTTLELLIVIAMIVILISITLFGLSNFRIKARDQVRINAVQTISLGLSSYKKECGEYPIELVSNTGCLKILTRTPSVNLGTFIPDIDSYAFNQVGSAYVYAPLSPQGGIGCTGYHIGAILESSSNTAAENDSQFESTGSRVPLCTQTYDGAIGNTNPFSGFQMNNFPVYDRVQK